MRFVDVVEALDTCVCSSGLGCGEDRASFWLDILCANYHTTATFDDAFGLEVFVQSIRQMKAFVQVSC